MKDHAESSSPLNQASKPLDKKIRAYENSPVSNPNLTRRGFVATVGVLTGGAYLTKPLRSGGATLVEGEHRTSSGAVSLSLKVNGQPHRVTIDTRVTLLDLLREDFGLTGTKKGCDHGQCGACTVLANGRRINSCLSLAVVHDGVEITTVEGLAKNSELHPVQSAFIEHDGFQCGYCTSGQICSTVALLGEYQRGEVSVVTVDLSVTGPIELTREEIRERMSGNICRCGAYPGIVAAVQEAHQNSGTTKA
ncbi:MAG: 2Fe-2S iron-sulfur cluster-binding protein [Terriglobales bacterium]